MTWADPRRPASSAALRARHGAVAARVRSADRLSAGSGAVEAHLLWVQEAEGSSPSSPTHRTRRAARPADPGPAPSPRARCGAEPAPLRQTVAPGPPRRPARGCSSMAEPQPSKLAVRVRFPAPARSGARPPSRNRGAAGGVADGMTNDQRGRVRVERGAKRVRAFLGSELVADTVRPLLVWEVPYHPAYYLPVDDVVAELLPTGRTERSPSRGEAAVVDVRTASHTAAGAGLLYEDGAIAEVAGHVRLDWGAMSAWFEEDEQVFTHPRSPYTRIDILPTSREVVVRLGDLELARSTRGHALFETGLPPRWYLPRTDVRMNL